MASAESPTQPLWTGRGLSRVRLLKDSMLPSPRPWTYLQVSTQWQSTVLALRRLEARTATALRRRDLEACSQYGRVGGLARAAARAETVSSSSIDTACPERCSDARFVPPTAESQETGHAQGLKPRTARKVAPGGKWTKEEDMALKGIVEQHGAKNWRKVAELLGTTRTDVQCLHRWNKVLKPGLHKGPWTDEEDNIVKEMVLKYGVGKVKWSVIAQKLQGRSASSVASAGSISTRVSIKENGQTRKTALFSRRRNNSATAGPRSPSFFLGEQKIRYGKQPARPPLSVPEAPSLPRISRPLPRNAYHYWWQVKNRWNSSARKKCLRTSDGGQEMMGLEGLMGYGGSGPFLVNGASVDLSMLLATAQQNAEDLLRMAGGQPGLRNSSGR